MDDYSFWVAKTKSGNEYYFRTKNSEWDNGDVYYAITSTVAEYEGNSRELEWYTDTLRIEEIKFDEF